MKNKDVKQDEVQVENLPTEEQELKEEHFESKDVNKNVELEQTILKLTEENNSLVEKVKLAQAETINYRKRKDEEVQNMMKYANEGIITELISHVDNFERAITSAKKRENSEEFKKYTEGFELIYNGLKNTLTKFGVEEINRVGEVFDANLEQALVTGNDPEKDDEVVLDVLQKGYKLKDRVIRPASVRINQK